jgi:hypothetical protein
MPQLVWRKAQMLVEETQQQLDRQRAIVADLERRSLDATFARKHLAMWEETLVRRIEILNQIRPKPDERP